MSGTGESDSTLGCFIDSFSHEDSIHPEQSSPSDVGVSRFHPRCLPRSASLSDCTGRRLSRLILHYQAPLSSPIPSPTYAYPQPPLPTSRRHDLTNLRTNEFSDSLHCSSRLTQLKPRKLRMPNEEDGGPGAVGRYPDSTLAYFWGLVGDVARQYPGLSDAGVLFLASWRDVCGTITALVERS